MVTTVEQHFEKGKFKVIKVGPNFKGAAVTDELIQKQLAAASSHKDSGNLLESKKAMRKAERLIARSLAWSFYLTLMAENDRITDSRMLELIKNTTVSYTVDSRKAHIVKVLLKDSEIGQQIAFEADVKGYIEVYQIFDCEQGDLIDRTGGKMPLADYAKVQVHFILSVKDFLGERGERSNWFAGRVLFEESGTPRSDLLTFRKDGVPPSWPKLSLN